MSLSGLHEELENCSATFFTVALLWPLRSRAAEIQSAQPQFLLATRIETAGIGHTTTCLLVTDLYLPAQAA
jgi:hypothetical protein